MTTKCNYNSVARPIVFCLHCILCLLTLSNCKMLLVCRMFFVFQFLYLVSVIHDLFHWWLFNMLEPYVHILATKRIVLASMSPRRKQILENIVCFSVNIVHILIFLLLLVLIVVYRVLWIDDIHNFILCFDYYYLSLWLLWLVMWLIMHNMIQFSSLPGYIYVHSKTEWQPV